MQNQNQKLSSWQPKIKNWVHGNQHLDTGYQEPRDEKKGEMLAKQ